MGNNVNGLHGKEDSMKSMLGQLNVGILIIQETKMYRPGNIKIDGFEIFEKLRKFGKGGGLLTAVHQNLNPMLCGDDIENSEFLNVDIKVKNIGIRMINSYGPQENVTLEEKEEYFTKFRT